MTRAMESGDVTGAAKDEVMLYGASGGPERVLLLGLGDSDALDAEDVRRFSGRVVRQAAQHGPTPASLPSPLPI